MDRLSTSWEHTNDKPSKEYRWCAIDAEGDVGNKGLLGVAFYSDEAQTYLTDHEQIKALLYKEAERGVIFLAHNASYDIPVIFWQLGLDVTIHNYNGRFNCGYWHYDRRRSAAQIWDSGAISGLRRLANLGRGIGVPKLPTPQRLLGRDPDRYQWRCETHGRGECLDCYATRDAEIPYRFMELFTAQLKGWGVNPGKSISAIAMDVWKSLDNPLPIALKDRRIELLGRSSYAGGRVETFKLGHLENVYCADISSAYPHAMLTTPYPDPDRMIYRGWSDPESVPWHFEGVAEVRIRVPSMYCPPLPYIHKGERMYPVGTLLGCWTFAELRHAMSVGCEVIHVFRAAYSPFSLSPFGQTMSILWTGRCDAKARHDPRELLYKLIMNNLYGRIGMGDSIERSIIREWTPKTTREQIEGCEYVPSGERQYLKSTKDMHFENPWKNVVWASQTTAAVRIVLHKMMLLQGDNLIYCDTDSIFSRAPIVGTSDGLGGLRHDGHYAEAIIAAPKMYALCGWDGEWQAKVKGLPSRVALQFLRDGYATFERPIKPNESGSRRLPAGKWIQVTKQHRHRPHRRTPTDPTPLQTGQGWTDTLPSVIG